MFCFFFDLMLQKYEKKESKTRFFLVFLYLCIRDEKPEKTKNNNR